MNSKANFNFSDWILTEIWDTSESTGLVSEQEQGQPIENTLQPSYKNVLLPQYFQTDHIDSEPQVDSLFSRETQHHPLLTTPKIKKYPSREPHPNDFSAIPNPPDSGILSMPSNTNPDLDPPTLEVHTQRLLKLGFDQDQIHNFRYCFNNALSFIATRYCIRQLRMLDYAPSEILGIAQSTSPTCALQMATELSTDLFSLNIMHADIVRIVQKPSGSKALLALKDNFVYLHRVIALELVQILDIARENGSATTITSLCKAHRETNHFQDFSPNQIAAMASVPYAWRTLRIVSEYYPRLCRVLGKHALIKLASSRNSRTKNRQYLLSLLSRSHNS